MMIKTFMILLAVTSTSFACIGGLLGGGSGGCCQASAPSCSSPCGGGGALPPPIQSAPVGGSYVTAPAVPFQSAPILPFAAPPPAQLPSNAYAFPAAHDNLNVPQLGGQSNFGYASPGLTGAQYQQQQPAAFVQQQVQQQPSAFVSQQSTGGYAAIAPQQPSYPSGNGGYAEPHGAAVYEQPSGQVHVVQPTVVTGSEVPEGSSYVAPSSGVQGSTYSVAVPVTNEQPAGIDYKGVLGNVKESKIHGKNGHHGNYDGENGSNYDDFEGYNPSDLNGEAPRTAEKTSVTAPSAPQSHVTIVTEQVKPASPVQVVTGPTETVPFTDVHSVIHPIVTAPAAPSSVINVVPATTIVQTHQNVPATPVVQTQHVVPAAPVVQTQHVVPAAPVVQTQHVVPAGPVATDSSKFTAPVSGPVSVNESTDLDTDQQNTGTGAVRPQVVPTQQVVAAHVEQPHATPSTVGQQNGGLDFHSVNHQVGITTSAPVNKPIQPFAPQNNGQNVEELDGDDYDTLDEDRPEVPVASTFTNDKEPIVEHKSSAEQPAAPSTSISTTNIEVPSIVSISSNQQQVQTSEDIQSASEGFDYGDNNDGASYDDVAEDGKTVNPSESKDYLNEPYSGIKKAAGTIQLRNAKPIQMHRLNIIKLKQ